MLSKIKLTIIAFMASISVQPVLAGVVYADCGSTQTRFISCPSTNPNAKDAGAQTIGSLIKIGILVMSILIGVVATGGIAYAAVLYASARDSEGQVEQSKTIIRNIMIGLLLYGFMIAIMNWLIPGGVIEIG